MSDRTDPDVSVVEVTPGMAEKWLTRNVGHNRTLSESLVKRYARDMTEGRWTLSPDAIAFDADGTMENGQHRMSAIVRSGTTQSFLVLRGDSGNGFVNYDTGRRRSTADVLSIKGYTNPTDHAAVGRYAYLIDDVGFPHSTAERYPSPSQLVDYIEQRRSDTGWMVKMTAGEIRRVVPRRTMISVGLHIAHSYNPKDAAWFIDRLTTGDQLSQRDSVLHFRNKMIEARAGTAKITMPARYQWVLFVKAWNALCAGEEMSPHAMRWRAVGPSAEPVPEMIGWKEWRLLG